MYVCALVPVRVHMYLCTYVCAYVHMYVHMYIRTYVHMYVPMYIYICTYVCMYLRMYIQSNLTIMNPGYNELPDTTNIDLKMYTCSLYVNKP